MTLKLNLEQIKKNSGPVLLETSVKKEWIDLNGHMNMAYYVLLFDQALTVFLEENNLGDEYVRENNLSMFALENHVTYQNELRENDPLDVHFQLIDMDNKFIHYFMRIFHQETHALSATMEQISLHVNMETRHPTRFTAQIKEKLIGYLEDHKQYPAPREMGRSIGIRRPQKIR
jgi:acyl-CoA thioester hydrolase